MDSFDEIRDEKPINDLHLNSAINTDELRSILGEDMKYDVYERDWVVNDINKMKRLMISMYGKFEFNFDIYPVWERIEPCSDAKTVNLTYPELKKIVDHLRQANEKKQIMDQFTLERFCSGEVNKVREDLINPFNAIMDILISHSCIDRGDPQQIGEVKSLDGISYCYIQSLKTTIYIGSQIVSMVDADKICHITNKPGLLMLMDVIGQRICLEISQRVLELTGEPGLIDSSSLQRVISSGDIMISRNGSSAYDMIAMFESICTGVLLKTSRESYLNNEEFLDEMTKESEIIIAGLKDPLSGTVFLKTLIEEMTQYSPNSISNTFCLYRIWGHPTVDVYSGMSKVFEVGTRIKMINPVISEIALLQFRKIFYMNYHRRNHKYPPNRRTGNPDRYLLECIDTNMQIDTSDPGYLFEDWKDIQTCKIWEIPQTMNMFHLISDKAVSPTLSEMSKCYHDGNGTYSGELRRGIIRWIKGESLMCHEFLKDVSSQGIDDDHLVIGMYEKEREIKNCARMFSLMSPQMRTYFVITEGMISDYILKYIPEITMKDSLQDLQKKMWANGKAGGSERCDTYINVDFSKWNTNMRDSLSKPLFDEMDKMFGTTNVISRTHEIFRRSLIYSCSGIYNMKFDQDNVPILEPPMSYQGHLGGFEGLRQKGWTILTVCIINYIGDINKIKTSLMGQGDNQMISIKNPHEKWESLEYNQRERKINLITLRDKIMLGLQNYFDYARLPIKQKETWSSTRLFMYGKNMIINGTVLCQSLKKITRSYALSNEGQVTLEGTLGVVFSNMASSCSTMYNPTSGYLICLLLTTWTCQRLLEFHPYTRKRYNVNRRGFVKMPVNKKWESLPVVIWDRLTMLTTLLFIPASIGGGICIPYTSFYLRGFPDQVSEAFGWIKWMSEGSNKTINRVLTNWRHVLINKTIEPDMLLQAPTSINLWKPPHPSVSSGKMLEELIRSSNDHENQFLRNYGIVSNKFDRKVITSGFLSDPMNPLLSHEIYETFPETIFRGIIKRIENTRTIKKMGIKFSRYGNLIRRSMDDEDNYIMYLTWRSQQSNGILFSNCSTRHAEICRNVGWGTTIIGVTTPHPIEVMTQSIQGEHRDCDGEFIITVKLPENSTSPYLGSGTKEKVLGFGDKSISREPICNRSIHMIRVLDWVIPNCQNLRRIIMENVETMTDISLDISQVSHNLSTGSVEHRFQSSVSSHGTFINYNPTLGTSCFVSGDFLSKYNRGQSNYTFMFQSVYSHCQLLTSRKSIKGPYHYHIECHDCIVPVRDNPADISNVSIMESLWSPEHRALMRQMLGYTQRSSHYEDHDVERIFNVIPVNLESLQNNKKSMRWMITSYLGYKCAKQVFGQSEGSSSSVGTEDLQGFSRIWSSKIHHTTLLNKVVTFLILLEANVRMVVPTFRNYRFLANGVSDRLRRAHLGKVTMLGSLMLYADFPKLIDNGVPMVLPNQIPVQIDSILLNIKSCLIQMIQTRTMISIKEVDKGLIPVDKSRDSETIGIIKLILIGSGGCHFCMNELSKRDDYFNLEECENQHISKITMRWRIVHSTLDAIMKSLPNLEFLSIGRCYQPVAHDLSPCYPGIVASSKLRESTSSRNGSARFRIDMIIPSEDYKMFKAITLPTGSLYKWNDIIKSLNPHDNVIFLGDGTGTTSYVAGTLLPDSVIYPMTKYSMRGRMIPQETWTMEPHISKGLNNVSSKLLWCISDNIYDQEWGERLNNFISWNAGTFIILSDIEEDQRDSRSYCQICEILQIGQKAIIKTYLRDLIQNTKGVTNISIDRIMISALGNNRYLEIFVELHKEDRMIVYSEEDIISTYIACQNNLCCDRTEIFNAINRIERTYHNLYQQSLYHALSHIMSLGYPISGSDLSSPVFHIITDAYNFINRNYGFIGGNRSIHSERRLIISKRKKIERAIIILILSVHEPSIVDDKIYNLKCINDNRHKTNKIKLCHISGYTNSLNTKDLKVSQTIRHKIQESQDLIKNTSTMGSQLSYSRQEYLGLLTKERSDNLRIQSLERSIEDLSSSSETFEGMTL